VSRQFRSLAAPPDPIGPAPRWFVFRDGGLLVKEEGDTARLPTAAEVAELGLEPARAAYLGRLGDDDCLAAELPSDAPTGALGVRSLRSLFDRLHAEDFQLAGRASQIVTFESTHRFCGRCAAPLGPVPGERARRCAACELTVYPRLSPAVIVLVTRGERALLARAANFPAAFYSTLAGFVEPGESLEETVLREIKEEVGVTVKNLRYFGSQPWPFPHSLMIGFLAEHAEGEIQVDQKEIIDAAWYDRDALPKIPPKLSIARRLIDSWLNAEGGARPAPP
jgi:NAD+ diphosphatase